ncbi:hypothetical protein E1202_21160 [Saccharopolyspora karakumensis]|uniref:Uncharacterized protein n=1 Tax=Saccharopolyspora karakumensis TaxID=2530386 RepID=A0A4R5BJU7_9PSEU|nr:hypothetical protein [Saccharopolyspora karakumensis]TDD85416.1 hypothetical protein E1202_21160 [Saccharopolyspora karakumensis]
MAFGTGFAGAVKYALLIAALLWSTAAFGYVTRLRPPNRIADVDTTTIGDQRATEIRYSGAQFVLINLLVACLFLCAVFAAWDYGNVGDGAFAPGIPMFLAAAAAVFFGFVRWSQAE